MIRHKLATRDGDRTAILLAAACFVHCTAGPLLLTLAGFGALGRISERLEPLFVLSSAILGAAALIPAYRSKHRRRSCLALFAGGLCCLVFLRHAVWTPAAEMVVTGIGAGLLIGAHALNLRFSRQCACCQAAEEPLRARR
jgi:hypothetical protein